MSQALKERVAGQSGGAVANPRDQLMGYFNHHRAQIAAALPKHLNPDRMARLALTAFSQSDQLQRCDVKSIFGAVVIASQMGLEIGVAGQGYLIPYGRTAQFVPGWQGIVDLISRSGRATVWTGAVFDGDDFDYSLGSDPFIRHKPCGEDDPSKLTHAYACGQVNGAQRTVIEVWPIAKIWRNRDRQNKQGKSHYSFKYPEMYARKIPLLHVAKYMPKSIELQNAITLEAAADAGRGVTLEGDFLNLDDTPRDDAAERDITVAQAVAEIVAINELDAFELHAQTVRAEVRGADEYAAAVKRRIGELQQSKA